MPMPGFINVILGVERTKAVEVHQRAIVAFAREERARNRLEDTVSDMLDRNDTMTGRRNHVPKRNTE